MVLFVIGCQSEDSKETLSVRYEITGNAQGTSYHIVYYTDSTIIQKIEVDSLLDEIDRYLSIWVDTSVISNLNRSEALETHFDDPMRYFSDNFYLSQKVYRETVGAFDPTIGPLVNAWGFGATGKTDMDSAEVDVLMTYVGFGKVSIAQADSEWVYTKPFPETQLDFNAIAQGYSVDVLSDYFLSKGNSSHMIEVGGELLAKGRKADGLPWKIGIDQPSEGNSNHTLNAIILLEDKALATSGNYRKFFEKDGVKYAHTINPATGFPIMRRLLSATIVANNCALADAYATSFMVMGVEKSINFLDNHPDLDAYLIYSDSTGTLQTFVTKGIRDNIEQLE